MSGLRVQSVNWHHVVDDIQHEIAFGDEATSDGVKALYQDAAFVEAVAKIALLATACLNIRHSYKEGRT